MRWRAPRRARTPRSVTTPIGWDVQTIPGNDMEAFHAALEKAKAATGKPQLIIARTLIGKGIPEVAGTAKAHGEGGAKFVDAGPGEGAGPAGRSSISTSRPETRAYFAEHKKAQLANYAKWNELYQAWRKANPELAKLLDTGLNKEVPADLLAKHPGISEGCQDRHAQGGQRGAAADRRGDAAAHRRLGGSVRLDVELHQRRARISRRRTAPGGISASASASTACARC